MSAPTPAAGEGQPREGYYPDPSIPGYVRYWNGVSWVPGTSRPAPTDGEPLPAPPGVTPAAQQRADTSQAPATQWGADPGRQLDPNSRTDWGTSQGGGPRPGATDPRGTGERTSPEPGAPGDVRSDGTVTMRAVRPGVPGPAVPPDDAETGGPADGDVPGDGTVTMRAIQPGAPRPELPTASPRGDKVIEGTVIFRRPEPLPPAGTQDSGPGRPASAAGPSAGESWGSGPAAPPASPHSGTPNSGTHSAGSAPAQRPAADAGTGATSGTGTGAGTGATSGTGTGAGTGATSGTGQGTGAPARRTRSESPVEGTMAIRMPKPAPPSPTATPQVPAAPEQPAPYPPSAEPVLPPAGGAPGPAFPGPAGGWPQQQGPQGAADSEPPVVPWKPPVEDPFLAAAQAQAAGRPAPLGKRLLARLVDTLVVGGVTALAAVPLGSQAVNHINDKIDEAKLSGETVTVWLLDGTTSVSLLLILGVLLITGLLYEALPTAKWGRTLGKKLLGLDVRDIEAHQPPGLGPSVRRWLVLTLPGLLVIGVLGLLWCVFDRPWRQCWHDKVARTFVAG